jgi:hypothetical protein
MNHAIDAHALSFQSVNENLEITEKRLGTGIPAINLGQPDRIGHVYSPDLCQTRNAWANRQGPCLPSRGDQLRLGGQTWSRPNEAHIAAKDVDQLREFIKFPPPEKLPNGRHRMGSDLMRGEHGRATLHRSQLVEREGLSMATHSGVSKQCRPV